jgi:CheY-like chemotaxis protein
MIKGVKPFMGFTFIPDITLAYYLLPLYYTVNVVYGHFILYKSIKTDTRNRFIFIGFVIGFSGGTTNLFPYMGIPIYPIGNFLISIYCPLVAYAIIRHRLFDISVVISEGIVRILTILTLGAFYFLLSYLYNLLIPVKSTLTSGIINITFLFISLESYNFLMKKFQSIKSLSKNSYKYEDLLKKINRELTGIADIGALFDKMVQIFNTNIRVKIISFAVIKDNLKLEFFGDNISSILPNNFCDKLKNLEFSVTDEEAPLWLKEVFKDYKKSSCLIPFISENKAVGFMMVEKESISANFSYNDLVLFDNLIFQVGIIIDRIGVYQRFSMQKQKFLEDKATSLKSLAGTIAHEIRNPLNTINLIQNQIKESLLDPANLANDNKDKILNLVSSISDSVTQANDIINIILNDLKEKPIDPSEFSYLNSTVIMTDIVKKYGYHKESERQKIKLELKDEFIFKAVPDRFIFIIYNLLKNAIHYFDQYPNATITIGTQIANSPIGSISHRMIADSHNLDSLDLSHYNAIYIHDTGPGISDEVLPKLFGDFFTSGKKDGTGLGLAFCKRNMIAFGGNILCESEFGKYTKFSLLFPKITDRDLSQVKTDAEKKKILIVDDQQFNLFTSKAGVEHNLPGIVCDTTLSGERAITLVKENKYCLILMDMNMPEMNGVETTAKIREFNKDVPIIAYTSITHEEFLQMVNDLPAVFTDYITKPIPNHSSYRTIAKWIIDYKDEFIYIKNEKYKPVFKDANIIIADDQKLNLMVIAKTLQSFDAKISTVNNGTELLEAYKNSLDKDNNSSFDLIITDINMPGLNGDEVVRQIRKYDIKIPIIIASGDGQQEDIYKFFNAGATDYFIKGNKPELLIKTAANYLTQKNPVETVN